MSDEMIHDIVLAMKGDPDEGSAAESQDSLKLLRLLEHIAVIGTIAAWIRHDMLYTPSYLAKQFYLLITQMNKETCEPD